MTPRDELGRAWLKTERELPSGWQLDGIRCTSTGLEPDQRGDRWCAVALGPDGASAEGIGDSPIEAMGDLLLRFRTAN